MHRTNIVLEEWHYRFLKDRADKEGKSMSAVVRELIEASTRPDPASVKDDPLFDLVGRYRGGRPDGAEAHDEIVYARDNKG